VSIAKIKPPHTHPNSQAQFWRLLCYRPRLRTPRYTNPPTGATTETRAPATGVT
jgi:hypothetical protein